MKKRLFLLIPSIIFYTFHLQSSFPRFFQTQKPKHNVSIENCSNIFLTISYKKKDDMPFHEIHISPGETIHFPYPWDQKQNSREIDMFELSGSFEHKKIAQMTVLSPNASPICKIRVKDSFLIEIQ